MDTPDTPAGNLDCLGATRGGSGGQRRRKRVRLPGRRGSSLRVAGVDIGPLLYALGVSGWLMLAAFPLMLLTLVAWVGVAIWAIVRRLRRPPKVAG